jgi:hypothetical protein
MKELSKNWLTEGLIDFEYKKYYLLAYLKEVKSGFGRMEMFPGLSDLVFHYRNLMQLRDNKELLYGSFPQSISKADFEKLELSYKKIIKDDEVMKEIQDIIEFALPTMKQALEEGRDIYEFIESNFEISTIGLCPLYVDEGYLFLYIDSSSEAHVHKYAMSVFENSDEKFRGITTQWIETFTRSLYSIFEKKKLELIRKFKLLPNPATYLIVSKTVFPYDATLMPIAKRLLIRHISSTGKLQS